MKKFAIAAATIGTFFLSVSAVLAEEISIIVSQPPAVKITDIGKLIGAAVGVILIFAALAAFIYLIWGGFQWITSGGDKAAVETAKHRIQAAILGLFIIFATWAIFLIVEQFFGVSILRGIKLPTPF